MNATSARTALDHFVEAFEAAQQRDGRADVAAFLPAQDHPLYLEVLRELVCTDLDYGWGRHRPTSLDEYRRRFPDLFRDPEGLRAVVWEEYRQRRQAGQEPEPEEYQRRYGVSPLTGDDDPHTVTVPVAPVTTARPEQIDGAAGPRTAVFKVAGLRGLDSAALADRLDALGGGGESGASAAEVYLATCRRDPAAADRYAQAQVNMPEVGDTFLGFSLEGELGHGTFGRVFLARQTELANRAVALKVSTELFGESHTLAQLNHTNIVPIYSRHEAGPVQAVCMPYYGGTTLTDVFRALKGKSLPTSGKHFVSTLHGHKNSTLAPQSAGTPSAVFAPDSALPSASGLLSALGRQSAAATGGGPAPATAALKTMERQSYVGAVLWMMGRLADGLAHAHERGILHRDLKPANILLRDDGEPMLLDFNLADDTKVRSSEAGARVGGTLPYMAPEQLQAFVHPTALPTDGRADLYSLGLIAYALLTGRPAFETPSESGRELIARMIVARHSPPVLRPFNAAVSPAAEAIVRRCLEEDPSKRYQSASDLKDDIDRHLADLPLKHTPEPSRRERLAKWARRHPRLTSSASVATIAAAALIALGVALGAVVREVRVRRANDTLREFTKVETAVTPRLIRSLDAEGRAKSLSEARAAVALYGALDQPDWLSRRLVTSLPAGEQERLRGRVGELLFLMTQATLDDVRTKADADRLNQALAFNGLAAVCFREEQRPQAWYAQRSRVLRGLGKESEATDNDWKAALTPLRTAQDHYLRAVMLYEDGQHREALAELEKATAEDPQHYWAWLLRGDCCYFLSQYNEALNSFSRCVSIDDKQPRAYFNRGLTQEKLGSHFLAADDFGRALEIDPTWTQARIERALAFALRSQKRPQTERDQDLAEAEAELTRVLDGADAPLRCYFQRAQVRRLRGNAAGEAADLKIGFSREPGDDDDMTWVIRGVHRKNNEPQKALDDFRRAEAINPHNQHALYNQTLVLAEKLNRPEETLAVYARLLKQYPEDTKALAERAVILARLKKVDEAVADVKRLETLRPSPLELYQAACVYALTPDRPGHAKEANRLLALSFSRGLPAALADNGDPLNPVRLVDIDTDLDPLRDQPEFRKLADAVRTLRAMQK